MGSWLGGGANEYARKQTGQHADEGRTSERTGYQQVGKRTCRMCTATTNTAGPLRRV